VRTFVDYLALICLRYVRLLGSNERRLRALAMTRNHSAALAPMDEMHRVLRPWGEAVVVDLCKDASLDDIDQLCEEQRAQPNRCVDDEVDFPPYCC